MPNMITRMDREGACPRKPATSMLDCAADSVYDGDRVHVLISTGERVKSRRRKQTTVQREPAKLEGVGDILASLTKKTPLGKRLKEAQIWQ